MMGHTDQQRRVAIKSKQCSKQADSKAAESQYRCQDQYGYFQNVLDDFEPFFAHLISHLLSDAVCVDGWTTA